MTTQLKEKRVAKLWEQAQGLLADGEYESALKIAEQLERDRHSGAFDIGAQALCGLGRLDEAIAMLERGVELAPTAWLNWELLGNCRSDAGLFEEAAAAYQAALACADVWADSIRINQAVLAERRGDYDSALALAAAIEDPELEVAKASVTAGCLLKKGQPAAAIAHYDAVMSALEEPSENDLPYLASLCATRAEAMRELGEPAAEVREFLLEALDAYPDSEDLLDCFRELKNEPSTTGRVYEVLISFEVDAVTRQELGVLGFVRAGHAIADTPEEAVALFCELETDMPLLVDGAPEVELAEGELVDDGKDALKGVVQRSDRGYYTSRD